MKRIEFIAPVESMRGNLGSRQNLVYAPDNNRAFDSIEGQINPALNYEPRLIGARKGRLNYFCVKTKSSVHLTQLVKQTMADLGAVGSMYAAIVRNKTAQPYLLLAPMYQRMVDSGKMTMSFRKWVSRGLGQMIKNKLASYTFTDDVIRVTIGNPWVLDLNAETFEYPGVGKDILVKFWMSLAVSYGTDQEVYDPIMFYIDGSKGVAYYDDDFDTIIRHEDTNVLGLEFDDAAYVLYNGLYVLNDNGEYMNNGWIVENGEHFHTTNVAPE